MAVDAAFARDLFAQEIGGILMELGEGETDAALAAAGEKLGVTTAAYALVYQGTTCALAPMQDAYEGKLEKVFPYRKAGADETAKVATVTHAATSWPKPALRTSRPVAVIPTFPGTNCEVDTARALERAGAEPRIVLINNLTPAHVAQSVALAQKEIARAQMIVFPGGFSGGDEPDGSGKFITAFFRNPVMRATVHALLKRPGWPDSRHLQRLSGAD